MRASPSGPFFVGVDGGGTGCRARIADAEGRVLGTGIAGPAALRLGLDRALGEVEKACRGEEIVIARGKQPVVRLVAIESKSGKRKPGAWKGKIKIGPAFFEPLPPEELEGWQ